MSRGSWWASKVRQTWRHLRARVEPDERRELAGWLTPAELALFEAMSVADQRHGLDVVARLRERGMTDREVLVAGLLHDAGKGSVGLLPRIVHSLGQGVGPWVVRLARRWPGLGPDLDRLRDHPERSAALAAAAGCPARTVELIRRQDVPTDDPAWPLLRWADETS
ncbi:MAG TPA: hypothetical protein VNO86_02015 [Candidatus Binatia bacterium]|nr:hypothetical protein [Candidatus Binatia bacterium]